MEAGIGRARHSDLILALFVMSVTAMLLIPLPTVVLDLLLALNISFALLLLLVGLYMPDALALLAFPSLLLLTTLFRLSLNVASTRLILSQGDAGRVIEAFGTFLIRGEIIVGVIIFTIITIVNFIVIARGASRVSEVAARFTLDALPGKQMAIDSDLRTGLITVPEARKRREDLRKESQLFGAMDGAMKFVQGDAIAGFFIILTNIFGGLYLGVSSGLSFEEAIRTYTLLTVGDGLVSQVPALLISICAGIVVTRISSGGDSTLGSDLGSQVFDRPAIVLFAGALSLLIGFLPGVPVAPFAAIGLTGIGIGWWLKRVQVPPLPAVGPGAGLAAIDSLQETSGVVVEEEESNPDLDLVVTLDSSVLYPQFYQARDQHQEWWRHLLSDFYAQVGVKLPSLRVVQEQSLPAAGYRVNLNGFEILHGRVPLDALLVEVGPPTARSLGIEVRSVISHPVTACQVVWAPDSALVRAVAEAGQIRAHSFIAYIGLQVASYLHRSATEICSIGFVHTRVGEVDSRFPGFLSSAFGEGLLKIPWLTEIARRMIRQGISIRNFRQFLEEVSAYLSSEGINEKELGQVEPGDVVDSIRAQRRRELISTGLSSRRTLKVLTLSNEIEDLLTDIDPLGTPLRLPLEPEAFSGLERGLISVIEPIWTRGVPPISILCSGAVRGKVQTFLEQWGPGLGVIAFEELDPKIPVEPVQVWSASDAA